MAARLIILVGPPGSGKSTLAKTYEADGYVRVSQDDQGKFGHQDFFAEALRNGSNIVVDRMNFNKQQRDNYTNTARPMGYLIEIVVIHESYETCLRRALSRTDHPTIKDERGARAALQTFFTKYERPTLEEAHFIHFKYPQGPKPKVIVCDLDGTLCEVEHRRHYVRRPEGEKKDWAGFFREIPNDTVNKPVAETLRALSNRFQVIYCSGRDDNQRQMTVDWLNKHMLREFFDHSKNGQSGLYEAPLYMRNRHDSRRDDIVKELILDFEILTRYEPYLMLDDRDQVVKMWRRRGYTCLQVAEGDF